MEEGFRRTSGDSIMDRRSEPLERIGREASLHHSTIPGLINFCYPQLPWPEPNQDVANTIQRY